MFAKTKEIDPSFWMIKRKEFKLWKWLHSDILQNPVKCSDGCPNLFNVTCSLSGKDRVESILFYHQRCSNYITHTITFFFWGVHTLKGLSPTDYYVWESVERRQWRERSLWKSGSSLHFLKMFWLKAEFQEQYYFSNIAGNQKIFSVL